MLRVSHSVASSMRMACFSSLAFDSKPLSLCSSQFSRILFGKDTLRTHLPLIVSQSMKKVLIVQESDEYAQERTAYVQHLLQRINRPCYTFTQRSPISSINDVANGYEMAHRIGIDGIIALGGGNVMDTSRAIAAMLTNEGNVEDYLRSQKTKKLEHEPLPHIIVPTIAGSGGEASTESLIYDEDAEAKISLTQSPIIPQAILIDPKLSTTVSPDLTIQGALTAMGQCIESLLLNSQDEALDALCMKGIRSTATMIGSILKPKEGPVKINGQDLDLREAFALTSLYSSLASVQTGFGAIHSIGMGLSSICPLPHLELCASFLPSVMNQYINLFEEYEGDEHFELLKKRMDDMFEEIQICSQIQTSTISQWFSHVNREFKVPCPSTYGFDSSLLDEVVQHATNRMEDVAKSETILNQKDIDTIVKGILSDSPSVPSI